MPDLPANSFCTTSWTQVVAAAGSSANAKQALRELCTAYYEPVELFVKRYRAGKALAGKEARDLTHEFFAKLLEGDGLRKADPTRGRFRSYLLGAVKHFLHDQHDREQAFKRGGSQTTRTLQDVESGLTDFSPIADPNGFPPDAYFDRQWALKVVEQAMATLRAETQSIGESARFEVLQSWLVTPSTHETAIEAARVLGLSDGAFKVAVHRLRKRFRQIVIERIASTVHDPIEVQDELNYLINALTSFASSRS
jgi:RNA polymerase sigma-70 factor (ECF subfamily)